MSAYATKFHRNGTVTIWNVFEQSWNRVSAASLVAAAERPFGNVVLPTLPAGERERIKKLAERFPALVDYDE